MRCAPLAAVLSLLGGTCGGCGGDSSADGRIAFTVYMDGNSRLALVDAPDGGNLEVLPYPTNVFGQPVWSFDGKKLAFDAGDGIRTMNVDATGRRSVYRPDDGAAFQGFSWSPDANRFAIADLTELFVVSSSGGEHHVLEPTTTWTPVWSPDGRTIAYSRPGEYPSQHIYLISPDGSNKRRLVKGPEPSSEPSWSADSRRLAYEGDFYVYAVDADGSHRRRLARGRSPSWSPDGNRIAFFRGRSLYVVGSDGHGERRLSHAGPVQQVSWSPDGEYLAFSRQHRTPSRTRPETTIWVVKVDGSSQRRIWPSKGLCDCGYPAWQPR